MSEYWVSKKKYWCQYCEIHIADDAPSRSQHENGLRHKGNKDRFIRSLYKTGIKKKQESEEEKREMKRVEEAAQAAYARDIGAGLATPGASTSTVVAPAPKPKPPPPKPSDPYTNYTTAASLGITDPDVDRLVAEAEARKSEGRVGDWTTVVPPPPPVPQEVDENVKLESKENAGEVRKRIEEPVDEDDTRSFKMRKRTVAVGLGEIYDPGVIRVKPRVDPIKNEPEVVLTMNSNTKRPTGPVLGGDIPMGVIGTDKAASLPQATEKPTWTRMEWKRAGEEQREGPSQRQSFAPEETPNQKPEVSEETRSQCDGVVLSESAVVKAEVKKEMDGEMKQETDDDIKVETNGGFKEGYLTEAPSLSTTPSAGSLFKKRKAPAGSTLGRRKF